MPLDPCRHCEKVPALLPWKPFRGFTTSHRFLFGLFDPSPKLREVAGLRQGRPLLPHFQLVILLVFRFFAGAYCDILFVKGLKIRR